MGRVEVAELMWFSMLVFKGSGWGGGEGGVENDEKLPEVIMIPLDCPTLKWKEKITNKTCIYRNIFGDKFLLIKKQNTCYLARLMDILLSKW